MGLVALVLVAWLVDTRAADGRVVRNTEVAGQQVGGLGRDDLRQVVAGLADRYADADVVIETPDGKVTVGGDQLGVALDEEATVAAILAEGRGGSAIGRPFRWLASLVSTQHAPVVVTADATLAAQVVPTIDPTDRRAPVEPSVEARDGEIVVVRGVPGLGVSGTDVAEAIPEAAASGELPIEVSVEPTAIAPHHPDSEAQELADEIRSKTAAPLPVDVGGTEELIPVEMLRSWTRSTIGDDGLRLELDTEKVQADLESRFEGVGRAPVNATFRVEGGQVVVVPGQMGSACCTEAAPGAIQDALESSIIETVQLPMREVAPRRMAADARAMGIVEPIGSFTTHFPANQSRVTNIHRISDLVRGVVVEPGGRFSVNGHVGERTREKGFADGGEIRNGVLETAVGGGISQFATTTFNAAFFAGLDIPTYQMHSLYFSRYPYGREATLSFPRPDLVIANNTGHGILLWPTYTPTSVTMTIYGTRTFSADQTAQIEEEVGPCKRVTTERTRTRLSDGRQTVDRFRALYRPEEGVSC